MEDLSIEKFHNDIRQKGRDIPSRNSFLLLSICFDDDHYLIDILSFKVLATVQYGSSASYIIQLLVSGLKRSKVLS